MKRNYMIPAILIILSFCFAPLVSAPAPQDLQTVIQDVNIDSLMLYVAHLSGHTTYMNNGVADTILTRYSYSPEIIKAKDYLVNRLEQCGYTVDLHEFSLTGKANPSETGEMCQGWPPINSDYHEENTGALYKTALVLDNIIAEKIGTTYPEQYYYFIAHYDSRAENHTNGMLYAPGADDNASGTATVLEAARLLAESDILYSIKFILFSGEEQGLWGSKAYAAWARDNNEDIMAVINIDMIAYNIISDNFVNCQLHAGYYNSSFELAEKMSQNIHSWSIDLGSIILTDDAASDRSDHAPFWDIGKTAVFVSEDWQWSYNPNYHTVRDEYSTLNPSYFHKNAQLCIGTLYQLATSSPQTGVRSTLKPSASFSLDEPYPNPFNPQVNISWTKTGNSRVEIRIYDILGRLIKKLESDSGESGISNTTWNGIGGDGVDAASGIYFVKATSDGYTQIKKILLNR